VQVRSHTKTGDYPNRRIRGSEYVSSGCAKRCVKSLRCDNCFALFGCALSFTAALMVLIGRPTPSKVVTTDRAAAPFKRSPKVCNGRRVEA
jgi:hypothetical protein